MTGITYLLTGNRKSQRMNIINIMVLIAYAGIHVFLALHHEPWRDESQAWILARNLSFTELPGICASEGHPILWFFFLKLCITSGVPFRYINLVSTLIMTAAAALLLWRSPFSPLSDLCILISPIFFYYNPVICRVYCIVVLLFIMLYILYPLRHERPVLYGIVVALIIQSHILVSGFAIGCILELTINIKNHCKRKNIIGLIIPVISLICMMGELHTSDSDETYIHINADYIRTRLQNYPLKDSLGSISCHFDYDPVPAGKIFVYLSIAILVILIAAFVIKKDLRKPVFSIGLITFAGVIYYLGIVIFVRDAAHFQMAIIFWLLVLFCVWAFTETFKEGFFRYAGILLFAVGCLLTVPGTFKFAQYDVNEPFSGSTEICEAVVENVPDGAVIVMHNDMYCTSIAAYLYDSDRNYTLWDVDNGCEFVIHKWGMENARQLNNEDLYDTICGDIQGECYFIYAGGSASDDLGFPEQMILTGRNTEQNFWKECYQIYYIQRGA